LAFMLTCQVRQISNEKPEVAPLVMSTVLPQVQLPEWALWLRPGINGDYASTTFRLYASSPAHPEVPLQVDLATGTLQQIPSSAARGPNPAVLQHDTQQQPRQQQQQKQQQAGSRCTLPQPADNGLVSQRLWAPTPDGTAVPFMLLQQADQLQRGPRPLLVEVYGAYGHVLEAEFKPHRLPLLARGWSVALAHVRGGGELGRR
jgi:protease II